MNSQEPNENSDLDNESSDGGSPGAEGVMALPDSAEIEKSPELGLEIRNLEIKSQESNENSDLDNQPRDGLKPRAEGLCNWRPRTKTLLKLKIVLPSSQCNSPCH